MSIIANVKALGASTLDLLRTRIELAAIELQEETGRLFGYLAWAMAAAVLAFVGLLLAVLFVLVLFWDSHRLLAVGGMFILFALGSMFAVSRLRAGLKARPPLMAATLAELRKDAGSLKEEAIHER